MGQYVPRWKLARASFLVGIVVEVPILMLWLGPRGADTVYPVWLQPYLLPGLRFFMPHGIHSDWFLLGFLAGVTVDALIYGVILYPVVALLSRFLPLRPLRGGKERAS